MPTVHSVVHFLTFATVTGLSSFPAGWHVAYSSTAVKLAH